MKRMVMICMLITLIASPLCANKTDLLVVDSQNQVSKFKERKTQKSFLGTLDQFAQDMVNPTQSEVQQMGSILTNQKNHTQKAFDFLQNRCRKETKEELFARACCLPEYFPVLEFFFTFYALSPLTRFRFTGIDTPCSALEFAFKGQNEQAIRYMLEKMEGNVFNNVQILFPDPVEKYHYTVGDFEISGVRVRKPLNETVRRLVYERTSLEGLQKEITYYEVVDNKIVPIQTTPLHMEDALNNIDLVQFLLDQGVNADATDAKGRTPSVCAAYHGRHAIAQLLKQHEQK